ncbi:uncharacterized protein ARMOST_11675 [Armillaria ostoyae]|uniref:Uncharacterized protein n=1 Tax=Armillaria ostoyae TaxID=47428 RepID=A0A284RHU1_ARMOS|nr:uncharacterized protein ARMOST_11675 [Armillaria ostoyae]
MATQTEVEAPQDPRKFMPKDDDSSMTVLWREYEVGLKVEGEDKEDSHSVLTRGQFYALNFLLEAQDIADDGFNRDPSARQRRFQLKEGLYEEIETLVNEFQSFLQKASALVPGGQRCYQIDPRNMLMALLKGLRDILILNTNWKALQEKMTRGHEFMVKYVLEYQADTPVSLSPVSTAPGLHQTIQQEIDTISC